MISVEAEKIRMIKGIGQNVIFDRHEKIDGLFLSVAQKNASSILRVPLSNPWRSDLCAKGWNANLF